MNKCYALNVEHVLLDGDITTLVVSDGFLPTIAASCDGSTVKLCIRTSFSTERNCTRIRVTDSSSDITFDIVSKNQYWRPHHLICNSDIITEARNDPSVLVFMGGECFG